MKFVRSLKSKKRELFRAAKDQPPIPGLTKSGVCPGQAPPTRASHVTSTTTATLELFETRFRVSDEPQLLVPMFSGDTSIRLLVLKHQGLL